MRCKLPLVIYKPCSLDNSNPNSMLLCLACLSTGQQTVLKLLNGLNPTVPSPPPVESSLNVPSAQSPAVIAETVMGGILAGALCTVITTFSWFVTKDSYAFNYLASSLYTLKCFFFSHEVCEEKFSSQPNYIKTQTLTWS